jgi:hypothetical protein
LRIVATARASTLPLASEIVKFPSEINNEILVTWNRYGKYCYLKCVLFAMVKITYSENYFL